MNPQDQLDANESTALYVKAREINLWTCWVNGELNPGRLTPAASGLTTDLPKSLLGYLIRVVLD